MYLYRYICNLIYIICKLWFYFKVKNIESVVLKDEACKMHGKNVSLFAYNMYNPRPHKYNELPVNDLSTKKVLT